MNDFKQFWDLLEEQMKKMPAKNIKILLGDFNAQ